MIREHFSTAARFVRFSTLRAICVASALIAVFADRAGAAAKTWRGPDAGNWSVSSYWNPAGLPFNDDDVTISGDIPMTFNASLTMDATAIIKGLSSITLDSTGIGGTFTINQTAPASLILAGIESIGSTVTGNVYNQTAGTNDVGVVLTLGSSSGAYGMYQLSGSGSLTVVSNEYVGLSGAATFNQSGGTHNVGQSGQTLFIGANIGSAGTYNLSGTGELATTGNEDIGGAGTGLFNQTGGTNMVPGYINIATGASGSGTYMLSAGSATVFGMNVGGSGGTIGVPGGSGVLTVRGTGVLTNTDVLRAFNTAGTAINLNGGTINTGGLNFNGVPSLLNWTSGTLKLTNDVTFDSRAAVTSTSNAFGPALTLGSNQTLMVTGNETLGGTGPFSLTLNDGSSHNVTGSITLNPTGTISQYGGSSLNYSSFTQTGGTVNGILQNEGLFIYQSGLFNGRLINRGSVSFGPIFTAGDGIENDATMAVNLGQTLDFSGPFAEISLENLGAFTLGGGVISGTASAYVVNDHGGSMSGFGTINLPFFNNGILNVNGVLRLNGSGVFNAGDIMVDGTGSAVLNGKYSGFGSISNSGTLVFNTSHGGAPDRIGGILNNNTSASLLVQGDGGLEIDAAPTLARASLIAVSGGSRLRFNVASGAATIGTGVTVTVVDGSTLELSGSVSALSSGANNRVNVINNSTSLGLLVSGTHQEVGNIDGAGSTSIDYGSDLTADHIVQSALVIGGVHGSPGLVTIAASDAHGNPLEQSSTEISSGVLAGSLESAGPAGVASTSSSAMLDIDKSMGEDPTGLASGFGIASVGGSAAVVPEPATWRLFAMGSVACLAVVLRRRGERRRRVMRA